MGIDFGGAEHHVPGIVDDDVDAPGLSDKPPDGRLHGGLGLHVQFERTQVDVLASRQVDEFCGIARR